MRIKDILLRSFGALALVASVTSCEDFADDYLTQANPNEFDSTFYWASLEDCDSGLSAVYNAFKNKNNFLTIEEATRNDLAWGGTYGTNASPLSSNVWLLNTFNSSTAAISNKWASLYKGVFYANQVIAGLDKVKAKLGYDLDEERWTKIKAQAHFFRGLFYFYLNTSFNDGQVPIFDFVPTSADEFYLPCNTSDDVKAFYRNDLEYAEANLPSKGGTGDWTSGDLGRPTSETASAVLGTSYLYEARPNESSTHSYYDKAKGYFEKIINNGNYKLAGPGDNGYQTNELNSESLLEVIYTYDFHSEYGTSTDECLTTTINANLAFVGGYAASGAVPSYWLYHSFLNEPVDKRRAENKMYMDRDQHGDLYYYYDSSYTRTETIGGVSHKFYPVMAKPSDIRPFINNSDMNHYILWNNQTPDDGFKSEYADKFGWSTLAEWNSVVNETIRPNDDLKAIYLDDAFSMVWPDSTYVFIKAVRTDNTDSDITKMKVPKSTKVPSYSQLTGGDEGSEGYYIICDNKDMMPVVPFVNDRSRGAVIVYDEAKINETEREAQFYDYINWSDSDKATTIANSTPYRYRNRSLRTHYSMADYYALDSPYYGSVGMNNHGVNWAGLAYFKKYTNWQSRTAENQIDFPHTDSDINLRLIRLADVYLMYAECLIKGGNESGGMTEAMKYVNRIRYRAGTVLVGRESGAEYANIATYQDTHDPAHNVFLGDHYDLYNDKDLTDYNLKATEDDIIDTVDELWEHIKHRERPLELVLDGHSIRSNDLRRWGEGDSRIQDIAANVVFTTTGTHLANLKDCFQSGAISFQTRHKTWSYRFKERTGDPTYNSYFWYKSGGLANTGVNTQYGVVTQPYQEYLPIPTSEANSNPYIYEVVDREDL